MVIALVGFTCGCNSVGSHIFTRYTVQRVADYTGRISALQARHCCRQRRILVTIYLRLRVSGNRDGFATDGLITVGHLKGHCSKIGIGIGKLISCQTHIRCTGFRSCGSNFTIHQGSAWCRCECEIAGYTGNVVQVCTCLSGITCHCVRISIINCGVICTHNGHGHINRGDFLRKVVCDIIVVNTIGSGKCRNDSPIRINIRIGTWSPHCTSSQCCSVL